LTKRVAYLVQKKKFMECGKGTDSDQEKSARRKRIWKTGEVQMRKALNTLVTRINHLHTLFPVEWGE